VRECGVLLVEHNTQVAGVVEEHLFRTGRTGGSEQDASTVVRLEVFRGSW